MWHGEQNASTPSSEAKVLDLTDRKVNTKQKYREMQFLSSQNDKHLKDYHPSQLQRPWVIVVVVTTQKDAPL